MRGSLNFARRAGGLVMRAEGGLLAMLQTLIAQGATLVVNFATGILTARLLGASGRGEFAAISLWLLLPSMLSIAGIQNGLVFEIRRRPEHAQSTSACAMLLTTAVFIPACAVSLWVMPWLMHGYDPHITTVARAVTLISVLNGWTVIMRQTMLAHRNFGIFNTSAYASSLVYLLFLLPLVVLHQVTPVTAVGAQVAGAIVIFIWVTFEVMRKWDWRRVRPLDSLRPLLAYSLKAAPIDVVNVAAWNVDRLVLVALISPAAFGLYAVSLSFARILNVLQIAISSVMFADLASRPRAEIEMFTHRAFRLLLWALIVTDGCLMLCDRWLLSTVYGHDFGAAVPIFRVLLLDASLACIAQVLMQSYLASGKPSYASFIQVGGFAISLTMIFLLAPHYDAVGVAVGLAAGSVCKTLMLLFSLRSIGIRFPSPVPQLSDVAMVMERIRRRRAAPPVVEAGQAKAG